MVEAFSCPVTGAEDWRLVKRYASPPLGETDFGLHPYERDLLESPSTGHIVNRHAMDLSALYGGDYWDRTYGGGRITATFERIMALPTDRSDNAGRIAFIEAFWGTRRVEMARVVLDVGSGLAVFPAGMKAAGWTAIALDPDPRAAAHARDTAGVTGIAADFMAVDLENRVPLVTLNKVLEHVSDPVAMLRRVDAILSPGGAVYVELPDGEAALAAEGPDREEFFIEHYCAFSAQSYTMLAHRAGFRVDLLERVVEPSGKYTLRGFLSRPAFPPDNQP